MRVAATDLPGAKGRPLKASAEARATLLRHLREALVEVKADPSRRLALLLLRIRGSTAPRWEDPHALAELEHRLRSAVRSKAGRGRQDSVAWLGGREFAILTAPLKAMQDAGQIARRLLALLADASGAGGAPAPLRAAIGIVAIGVQHGSAEEILARARRAVAGAEEGGIGWADNLT
jgi:predicted signal transduction protein with EAL and GGDEF domain